MQQINQAVERAICSRQTEIDRVQTNSQHLTEELTALEASLKTASDALRFGRRKTVLTKRANGGSISGAVERGTGALAAQSSRFSSSD